MIRMVSTHIQLIVKNTISVLTVHHTSTVVDQASSGMMLLKHVIGRQMLNVTQVTAFKYLVTIYRIFNHVGGGGGGENTTPETTQATEIATTSSTVTSPSTSSGAGALCSDPNGLYSHATDCQKYYQCAHGTPYEYTCAAGTLWNDDLKSCDWEANVTC